MKTLVTSQMNKMTTNRTHAMPAVISNISSDADSNHMKETT